MSPPARLSFQLHFAQVTPSTCWTFVRLETGDGVVGWGEATLPGSEAQLRDLAPAAGADLQALAATTPDAWAARPRPRDLPAAAIASAVDMALWDIAARSAGLRVADLLAGGTPPRDRIELYANINRRTLDRSPSGFAHSALAAVGRGFTAIKVAAFDEAGPGQTAPADIEPGLRRLEAVRDILGADIRLMVDCHWRLDVAASERVIDAAAGLDLHWVECPLPETPETLEALTRLRARANGHGVLLAGGERAIGLGGFEPYLSHGAYDVLMPDAKYVGGLAEMMQLSGMFAAAGVAFSPHNPTGPICHAASLQVCAAVRDAPCLELQFDETDAFDDLQGRPMAPPIEGHARLPPHPGLGADLLPHALRTVAAELPA